MDPLLSLTAAYKPLPLEDLAPQLNPVDNDFI